MQLWYDFIRLLILVTFSGGYLLQYGHRTIQMTVLVGSLSLFSSHRLAWKEAG